MEDADKQPVAEAKFEPKPVAAVAPMAPMEAAEESRINNHNLPTKTIEMAPATSRTSTPKPINGHPKSKSPIEDDDTANEDNLSPPPESMSSGPLAAAEDEIVVGNPKVNGDRSSPIHADDDDVEMGDADDQKKSSSTPYSKRKRGSPDYSEDDDDDKFEKSIAATPSGDRAKSHGLTGAKSIPVGYWRESKLPDADKHLCVAFIDTRDRLRTRLQKETRDGRAVPKESIPVGPGGSWVTFDRIVFDEPLIGMDHNQIKEYVKIRNDQIRRGESDEEKDKNIEAAITEAKKRVEANPPPETPNGTQVAYGKDIPEHAIVARPENKRRRLLGPADSPQPSPFGNMSQAPSPALPVVPTSASRYPLDPLNGTRPTKILIGYWNLSSEPNVEDKHAVFGILGANDMFRVKLARETRDGRTVIGNFPTGAGALWINYEDVVFEPHLRRLSRPEIKEYTRVRQRQLDDGETPDKRVNNETAAVFEAQRRVGVHQSGGELRPPPQAILPTLPRQQVYDLDPMDDPDFPINSIRPRMRSGVATINQGQHSPTMGHPAAQPQAFPQAQPPRPEMGRRTSSRALPPQGATEPVNRGLPPIENNLPARRTGGPVPAASEVRAINRDVQPVQPIRQPQPHMHQQQHTPMDRAASMAHSTIERMEQARDRIRDRETSRASTPRSSFIENPNHGHPSGPANNYAGAPTPMNNGGPSVINRDAAARQARDRLQDIWVDQEQSRVAATGSEDEKVYNGIKYERRPNGPFANKLASQGNIITIDGVDYVEYRILMVPSFH